MSLPEQPCAGCGCSPSSGPPGDDTGRCSQRCRTPADAALEAAILDLLAERADDATICPSEAARRVGAEDWRGLMEPARAAARRLVAAGEVEVTQSGHVVDPATARGPIRLRRRRR